MTTAFVTLTADRMQSGEVRKVAGSLQQETLLFQDSQCVCKLLVIYPPGSPEWVRWHTKQTLDGMPAGAKPEARQP